MIELNLFIFDTCSNPKQKGDQERGSKLLCSEQAKDLLGLLEGKKRHI